MEFTTVLTADDTTLLDAILGVEAELTKARFEHDGTANRVEYDRARGCFDERVPPQTVGPVAKLDSLAAEIAAWQGVAMEFWNGELQLYVLFGHTQTKDSSYLNVFVDIEGKTLSRLLERDALDQVFGALGAVAGGCGAVGGFGELDLGWSPVPPSETIAGFSSLPDYPDEIADLGMFPVASTSEAELMLKWGRDYRLLRHLSGYFILSSRSSPHFNA